MSQYKISQNGISGLMLKRVAAPFIFGIVYFAIVLVSLQYFGERYSSLSISLVILGIMGFLYATYYLLGDKGVLFEKVKISILDTCIVETNSVDYGDRIYYPLIKYEYIVNENKYFSSNICLDSRSCYLTVWHESENMNKGLKYAEQKLDELLSNSHAYILKRFPSISYLDISLRKSRKIYFVTLSVLSVCCLICGLILL